MLDDKIVGIKLWPERARRLADAIERLADEAETQVACQADRPKRLRSCSTPDTESFLPATTDGSWDIATADGPGAIGQAQPIRRGVLAAIRQT